MSDERLPLADWLAERSNQISLVFVDVVESTALLYRARTVEYTRMLRAYRHRAVELISQQDGRVIDESGDGVLAAFPTARGAFDFARTLHAEPGNLQLRLRVGGHYGSVRADANALVGRNVHLAARVMQHALEPECWISDALKRQLEAEVPETAERVWLADETCQLKGVPEPQRLWRVS
jgi:class 3 adenylate cyclase